MPGNYTASTQPYPTWPEPVDRIVFDGITDEFVIDFTRPKEQALTILNGCGYGYMLLNYLIPMKVKFINNIGCLGGEYNQSPACMTPPMV